MKAGMHRGNFAWVWFFGGVFVALLAAGFVLWDAPVAAAVRAGACAGLKDAARFLSRYGDFPFLLGAGVVCLGVLLRCGGREWARIVTAMILAGCIAGLSANVLKLGTGRVRPRVDSVEPGWYGPRHGAEWVSLQHDFQAFPSSHASCAFGFFFPLFFSRRLAGLAGLAAAALVSWSRVQLNAHHVSDVAAGALLGLVAGWFVWRWIVERGGLSRWLGAPEDQAGA